MKLLLTFLFSLSILFFNGCASKEIQIEEPLKTEQSTETEEFAEDEDDEFLDEFEEEMEVKEVYDPLEPYNRVMTSFNDGFMEYVLTPVANGYNKITHKKVQKSVKNFLHNILYPVRLVNNLLQGKFKNSAEETGRFVINTTIGIFGLFDPAKSYFNLEAHNEDFGQTLGYWGVESGPHIVLPFLGPSNLRDSISLYPNSLLDPVDHKSDREYNLTNNFEESLGLKMFKIVNTTALSDGLYQKLKADAVDLYPFLRDMYEQRREQQIKE